MMCYVVLLCGVNVGGVIIMMVDLVDVVCGFGYSDVMIVLVSGNVFFGSLDVVVSVKVVLEVVLCICFGYEVWV